MKKRIILTSIISVLLTIGVFYGWLLLENNETILYKPEISTEDVEVNNFSLIRTGNRLYVQDGYIFKLKNQAKINSIYFEIYIDGTKITDFAGGDNFEKSNERTVDSFKVIPKIKISQDSKMIVRVKYTINGEGREFYDTILLNSIIKYKQ